MKSLILGSGGFIGSYLVKSLTTLGDRVLTVDVKNGVDQDLRKIRLEALDADRIFFLAWDHGGYKYINLENVQIHQLNWNLAIMKNVFPQLAGKKFVFVSSKHAAWSNSIFGVCKRMGELWTEQLGGRSIRVWNTYGTLEPISRRSRVVSDFIQQTKITCQINVLTDGSEVRQFLHLADLMSAMISVLDAPSGQVYDATSGVDTSIKELAELVGKFAKAPVKFSDVKRDELPVVKPNLLPGWKPKVALLEGVTRML